MRTLLLCCVLVGAVGCGAPASSLAACSFTEACQSAEETCWASQVCGPPAEGDLSCGPEEGDFKCHRTCSDNSDCGPGEACVQVNISERSDISTPTRICQQAVGR